MTIQKMMRLLGKTPVHARSRRLGSIECCIKVGKQIIDMFDADT